MALASSIATTTALFCCVTSNPAHIGFQNFPSHRVRVSASRQCYPTIYCGRGDRRTKKGKRFNHSYGNARPRNSKKGKGIPPPPLPPRPLKSEIPDTIYEEEKAEVEIDEPTVG
eukprot:TRINITY_DN3316_c0_g1_i1.p1 TRINITY_DN3316_c0_g1~~TRINITY_DN3316_c0_g1_i1.p1  ORF type:complete len:114 (+),score=11.82 TRINITY_DN3316_c0_g1_i1:65-406(+)